MSTRGAGCVFAALVTTVLVGCAYMPVTMTGGGPPSVTARAAGEARPWRSTRARPVRPARTQASGVSNSATDAASEKPKLGWPAPMQPIEDELRRKMIICHC